MPVPNTIFEKVIFKKLYPKLQDLLTEKQYGFVRVRMVVKYLIEFTHYISEVLDTKTSITGGCRLHGFTGGI